MNLLSARKSTKAKVEAIEMRVRRFGYFPAVFKWRGQEYRVCKVDRVWTTGSSKKFHRHYSR